ncbi:MAG: TIGR03084 family metal-binding protein [Actinomycetota bacterium]
MPTMESICKDLHAEHEALDKLVCALSEERWNAATPAEPWMVRDQISHLHFFDDCALRAVIDPEGFRAWVKADAFKQLRPEDGVEGDIVFGRSVTGSQLLERWRDGRGAMLLSFGDIDPKTRVPWFGPDMSAASFATARLMETWAHGQDVADALGTQREPTDRLKHVCHIGVTAIPWSYTVRKLDLPTEPIHVSVTSPSGEEWTWGPDDATNRVSGTSLDLALVVTQRRHRHDTDLKAEGDIANKWLDIAQAFAGPPGPGRQPGQFR